MIVNIFLSANICISFLRKIFHVYKLYLSIQVYVFLINILDANTHEIMFEKGKYITVDENIMV